MIGSPRAQKPFKIKILEWPSQSRDLNPTEMLWQFKLETLQTIKAILQRRVSQNLAAKSLKSRRNIKCNKLEILYALLLQSSKLTEIKSTLTFILLTCAISQIITREPGEVKLVFSHYTIRAINMNMN